MVEKESDAQASMDFFKPMMNIINQMFATPPWTSDNKPNTTKSGIEGHPGVSQETLLSIIKTWGQSHPS